MPGALFVVSGPSGSGKSTLIQRLRESDDQVVFATTATTRSPRPGEVDAEDYYFLSREEFERRIGGGDFVEWAEVHGNLYGTLRSELEKRLRSGQDVFLQIDVQGMRSIRQSAFRAVTVFVKPPSMEELEQRLRVRATEAQAVMDDRLRTARKEMAACDEYDHVVVNEDLDRAVAALREIVEHYRHERNKNNQA